jgi:hypothetical protein
MGNDQTRGLLTPLRQQGKLTLFQENLESFIKYNEMQRSVVSAFVIESILKYLKNFVWNYSFNILILDEIFLFIKYKF